MADQDEDELEKEDQEREAKEEAAAQEEVADNPEAPSEDNTDQVPDQSDAIKEAADEEDFGPEEARAARVEKRLAPKEKEEEHEDEKAEAKDENLDKEMEQEPQQVQRAPSALERYQQYIDQYQQLQKNRQKGDLVAGLMAAGNKVGQSMAGRFSGNVTPDMTGPQMVQQMAGRPVTDFEQGQIARARQMQVQDLERANDPSSPQSQLIRQYLNTRLGMDLPDTISANDAMSLMKTIGRPLQTKFQKVTGTAINEASGKREKVPAIFNPAGGPGNSYIHAETGKALKDFLPESVNTYTTYVDPATGERKLLNRSSGGSSSMNQPGGQLGDAQTTNEFYTELSQQNPKLRDELNNKVVPQFNKLTEKVQQRLMHEGPIMARLQEAQVNPAALAQLQAEMARFDVGDQRLAQQEFNMFAVRHGYKNFMDWVQRNTKGTISADFADDFRSAVENTVGSIRQELNKEAERQANTIVGRLPPGQKVDPKLVAKLIYGGYQPQMQLNAGEEVRLTKTGRSAVFNSQTKKFVRWADEGQ